LSSLQQATPISRRRLACLIFSTAITASNAVGGFVNVYVGAALLLFFMWLGMKTGFFDRLSKK
jgi:hypothetical protein